METKFWKITYWMLFLCWITGAALFMARIKGGFLTNYLSDITFPAWFYIHIRGLATIKNRKPHIVFFKDWFGSTPLHALLSILSVGIITEVKTFYFPSGIITGTFDYFDIAAYALGLLVCYYFDIRQSKKN